MLALMLQEDFFCVLQGEIAGCFEELFCKNNKLVQ